MTVVTGLDALIATGFSAIKGQRVGLLSNPSAVTGDLVSAYEVFRRTTAFRLAALFSPEHGFAASAADGEKVSSSVDPVSGAPIYSLYGESLRPMREMLAGLDALVCDLQDIGTRYYTYAWTITHAVEAAGEAGLPVILLDRPNPLGSAVDGPLLQTGYESLVGRCPVPIQHGLTLGELVGLFNARWNPTPAAITVVTCQNYQRGQDWESTGLIFVPPSPAMAHLSTVRQYPGACLIEGTNLSEGRGTALPFEICGAPFIDSSRLADHLNGQGWAGVRFRPHSFKPAASKYAGQVCHGVQAHPVGEGFRSLRVWVGLIAAVRDLYPEAFGWITPPGSTIPFFDRLAGSDRLRQQIEAGQPLDDMAAEWDQAAADFQEQSREFWLYG